MSRDFRRTSRIGNGVRTIPSLTRVFLFVVAVVALLAVAGASGSTPERKPATPLAEVVLTLPQPALAEAARADRTLAAATTAHRRLNVRAPASVSYLRTLASAQRTLQARIVRAIPGAQVHWRYGVVLNGMAVAVPRSELPKLRALGGFTVWPNVTYKPLLDKTPALIGATALWGPTLATAGEGIKIGVIDDGIDQTHPFFDPSGFSYPAGFPKGQTAYTTPKVIVARAFPRAGDTYKYANVPFDPKQSDHATHVAGIAAGDFNTLARDPGGQTVRVSGIAPRAYLGNYKVLTIPTADFGLNGNSPEIAAAIEAAVRDGMDVINLSLGEPEIEPSRDIVVKAINAAADANVVSTIAAGNDFDTAGRGSVGSPANAQGAITVAAASGGHSDSTPDTIAGFSSSGPTPLSLQMKPDVTAPGEGILSSVPRSDGSWAVFDGTSMAAPHVAGAAALLRQRHPGWSVAQVKSALETTGDPVHTGGSAGEVPTTREGGGRVDLPRADAPLVFASPTGISFGLVRRGGNAARTLTVSDAGGGAGTWQVAVQQQSTATGLNVTAPATVTVPGSISVAMTVAPTAETRDITGFIVLTRGSDVRRIPYWLRTEEPKLALEPHATLTRPGTYRADTRKGRAFVSTYRYPERGSADGVLTGLAGPEVVYRFRLTRMVANFGVAVVSRANGVRISPRVVVAGDENRLLGYTALPVNINPYGAYARLEPVVGAVLPAPGDYDFVFDTTSRAVAGKFSFRFWVNDVTPPTVRLVSRRGTRIVVAIRDAGAGVDPLSLDATVDGRAVPHDWTGRNLVLTTQRLGPGTHRLVVTASDYQEAKNMEDVGPVLPNTRVLRTTFRIR
jgi:subtilisin family serine protease